MIPGEFYLVDMGRLIPVFAKDPADAADLARLDQGSAAPVRRVYRLDGQHQVIAVIESTEAPQ
jgi:hypothetical protein